MKNLACYSISFFDYVNTKLTNKKNIDKGKTSTLASKGWFLTKHTDYFPIFKIDISYEPVFVHECRVYKKVKKRMTTLNV